jgi:hypothetical protein
MYKFRAWCKKDNKYYYDGDLYTDKHGNVSNCYVTNHGIVTNNIISNDDILVELYSGILDNNEKEIAENDYILVRGTYYGDYIIKVIYNEGLFLIDKSNCLQVKNSNGWDKDYPCVNTNGFNIGNDPVICSNTGRRVCENGNYITKYDIEVVGNDKMSIERIVKSVKLRYILKNDEK